MEAHAANFSYCISKYKAEIKKEKKTIKIQKKNKKANNNINIIDKKEKKPSLQLNTDI